MRRIVVVVDRRRRAVVDRVLKLADDVHPVVHVGGALLDRVDARVNVGASGRAEIGGLAIRVREGGRVERGEDPLVGVIEIAVVVVELHEGRVRAASAPRVHLARDGRGRREALEGAARLVGDRGRAARDGRRRLACLGDGDGPKPG